MTYKFENDPMCTAAIAKLKSLGVKVPEGWEPYNFEAIVNGRQIIVTGCVSKIITRGKHKGHKSTRDGTDVMKVVIDKFDIEKERKKQARCKEPRQIVSKDIPFDPNYAFAA
jgi:hypothetical protein